MPYYDFKCPACGVFEQKARITDQEVECACGAQATRLSVYEVNFGGFARPAVNQREIKIGAFQEASAEVEYQHSRRTNVDGSEKPAPPLWKMAKQEAKRLMKLGVKDSLDVKS